MNQLGKNLVLSLCVVATLLVILGLKRRFGDHDGTTLLSQPADDRETTAPTTSKSSPRPRVLQAKPVAQHDREIVSPTSPQYAEAESSSGGELLIAPIPNPIASPSLHNPPGLVPVGVTATSPALDNSNIEESHATRVMESPADRKSTQPLLESVITRADDSFWTISEQVYGSGTYYRALFRHNEAKVLRPDQLRAGIKVETPPLNVLRELYPGDFPTEPLLPSSR